MSAEVLSCRNVEAGYRKGLAVLRGVSLHVREGQVVALLGSNGAGKSTLLRAVMGLIPDQPEKGEVVFRGARLNGRDPDAITRLGVVLVPEGRGLFPELTVEENLQLVGYARPYTRADYEAVLDRFPVLRERKSQQAGTLSGGEQQMLAIARALLLRPSLLLLDEPSLGLAPLLVREIMEILARLNREQGIAILLVEQNAKLALEIAQHAYVLENGRVVMEGPAAVLRDNPDIKEFYLGLTELGARKRFREAKWYKRRKRWLT
ncbi:MAG: ABC transporter ATP-binding protein [candidate division GAL15 bacterium]